MSNQNSQQGDPALSDRDLAALRFIGEGYEVAQYQLHAAVFPGRVPTVVSRFVTRAAARKLVALDRANRTGINRLRLTGPGKAVLVENGFAHEDELFVPKNAVALKDLAHTLWINDARVAVDQVEPVADLILPAWALQRRLQPPPVAIPDLLAIWNPSGARAGLALACEIDLGGEGLQILVPKLERLFELVERWAAPSVGLVIVLCRGRRRRDSILQEVTRRRINAPHAAFEVQVLPERVEGDQISRLSLIFQTSAGPGLKVLGQQSHERGAGRARSKIPTTRVESL
jgi:hypothetical protein